MTSPSPVFPRCPVTFGRIDKVHARIGTNAKQTIDGRLFRVLETDFRSSEPEDAHRQSRLSQKSLFHLPNPDAKPVEHRSGLLCYAARGMSCSRQPVQCRINFS
jgi:hypothetical protein